VHTHTNAAVSEYKQVQVRIFMRITGKVISVSLLAAMATGCSTLSSWNPFAS
jgi:hypothetical protein